MMIKLLLHVKALLQMKLLLLCEIDYLVTGHCVVQFSLLSYSWLTNQTTLSGRPILLITYDYRPNWTPLSPIQCFQ